MIPDPISRLNFLWYGAKYQDNLLQSYRSFHFIVQSVMLAVGAALSATVILLDDSRKAWSVYGILIVVTVLAVRLLYVMRKLILARRDDVNYFHHHILETEKNLPAEQHVLTQFKIYQKFNKQNQGSERRFNNDPALTLTNDQLLEKGKGHTRQLLDTNVSVFLLIVWCLFHAIIAVACLR